MLPSPCINLCQMNPKSGLCQGCFRSIDEITRWAQSDDATRSRILAAVARRRQAEQPAAAECPGSGNR